MILLYDGSFEGFLCTIFESYAKKIIPEDICSIDNFQELMFAEKIFVSSNSSRSERVWKAWQKKIFTKLNQLPLLAFLSAQPGIEMNLYHFARLAFASSTPIEGNYSDPQILEVRKASRRVTQEAMRMLQFVRFQQTKDGIYFSGIRPRYDVLPMTLKHFKDRFADQNWIIYDMKRDYGFYYNQKNVDEVYLNDKTFNTTNGRVPLDILEDEESEYQSMWNEYCKNITIKERLNLKLQKQHMPKRYWRFLPEKNIIK